MIRQRVVPSPPNVSPLRGSLVLGTVVTVIAALFLTAPSVAAAAAPTVVAQPDFGPNVVIFDPSMPTSQIQAKADAIHAQQSSNESEMGTKRYALLFKPGTYGSAADPLNFQVGYYTEVAGLGLNPTDVVINGTIDVYNQCSGGSCIALNNFWRSMSNLTINVAGKGGCQVGEFWAVSQAAPMRRVNVNGFMTLMDYCTGPSFASGGFIADSKVGTGNTVVNGSQQQFYVRNSSVGSWTNGVWNQVFSGVDGAPAECFPSGGCGGPYTTLDKTPASREKPYLYIDGEGRYMVRVPEAATNTTGVSWANGVTPGKSIPLSRFVIAHPGDSVRDINAKLARGMHLLLTPGVYDIDKSIRVDRPNTVVLGMGLATLTAMDGAVPLKIGNGPGVVVAGLTVDAGMVESPVLLQVGTPSGSNGSAENPTTLSDVFFRIGGPQVGKATVSLEVNSDNVILDDIWAWRADHGNPGTVGWDINTAQNGVIVNGDDVTATGFFVEHYQKNEVIWNGERGTVVFFQNEMPYDPPSQAAWTQPNGALGWSALKVADPVKTFNGYGMGSYSFFNQGVDIYADNAFEVPSTLPAGSLHNMLTIFLDPSVGMGGILNVVNGVGGSSTIANPDVPVTVVNYP
jgi:hypothetical protein